MQDMSVSLYFVLVQLNGHENAKLAQDLSLAIACNMCVCVCVCVSVCAQIGSDALRVISSDAKALFPNW